MTTIILYILSTFIIVFDCILQSQSQSQSQQQQQRPTGFFLHHEHQTPRFSYSYTINHLKKLKNNDRSSLNNDLISQPSSQSLSTRINHRTSSIINNHHRQHFGSQINQRLYPYLEKPFQRLCLQQSKFHRGFYVGRSNDGKHCYYVCPDNPQKIPIGQVNYFCCRSGFGFDFQTKVCIKTQSLNPLRPSWPTPSNVQKNNNHRWPFQPTKWSNPWNKDRTPSTKPKCIDGETKPHPFDCQRYYRCLFNHKFVEMKCPFEFGWNPMHKICDPTYRQQCRRPILKAKPPMTKNDNYPVIKSKWPSKSIVNRFWTKFNERVCMNFFSNSCCY